MKIRITEHQLTLIKNSINEAPISNYRDNKHFKGASIKYPDNIFAGITTPNEANVAINFYKKIILLFNKMFNRNFVIESQVGENDFKVVVVYENGLRPQYYAYPSGEMGKHVIQDYINKYVPATSLRHELFHEIFVPEVMVYFDLVNHLDNSSNGTSVDAIQRDRVNNYTLEDIFYERLVEYLERNPDFADTFPMSDFMIDVVNKIKWSFKDENAPVTKNDVLIKVNNILKYEDKTSNKFLLKTIPYVINKANFNDVHTVQDLDKIVEPAGRLFEQYFNMAKDIFSKDVQYKMSQFQKLFIEEYYGAITKLNKYKR